MATYTYPFDPTGLLATNKVVETQSITPPNGFDYYFIIPAAAPFFAAGFKIYHIDSQRYLELGVDYHLTHRFHSASKLTSKSIYGSISFLDKGIAGSVRLEYQTVGDKWVLSTNKITQLLENLIVNPRIIYWEQVSEYPAAFPPIDHIWDVANLKGMEDVVDAVDRITNAVLSSDGLQTVSELHINNYNNPHQTNKNQIGLGLVQNFAIASESQARIGLATDVYMTPQRTAQAIDSLVNNATQNVAAHANDFDNPHRVTLAQLGLTQIQDYPIATMDEARAGTSNVTYMTPLRTSQAIAALANSTTGVINTHVFDYNNPHRVSHVDVGLGNVLNYGVASQTQAQATTDFTNGAYMTPLRTKEMFDVQLNPFYTSFELHRNDRNPHGTRPQDIGLLNIRDYGPANDTTAAAGVSSETYLTPASGKAAFNTWINPTNLAISAHLMADNPHQIDSVSVGLGAVKNYGMANDTTASSRLITTAYMSPYHVAKAFDVHIQPTTDAHIAHLNDFNNPHRVDKTQVGLGAVINAGMATDEEAINPDNNAVYVSPRSLKIGVDAHTAGILNTVQNHLNDFDNPHNVTMASLGYDKLLNLGIPGSEAEAASDVSTLYMTPWATKQAFTAHATPLTNTLNTHLNDFDNPHRVDKTQLGLGLVENFGVTTEPSILLDNNDFGHYVTISNVHWLVDKLVGAAFSTHAANMEIHTTSAASIGLEKVENFRVATDLETLNGGTPEAYVTPTNIKYVIDQLKLTSLNGHLEDRSNPHGVTKTQLGLELVNNYGIASAEECVLGESNTLYITPSGCKAAIDELAVAVINNHANQQNPHNTTPESIGAVDIDVFTTTMNGKLDKTGDAANALRFDGRDWTSFNTLMADTYAAKTQLADSSVSGGATLIGVDGTTLQTYLLQHRTLANLTALNNYEGLANTLTLNIPTNPTYQRSATNLTADGINVINSIAGVSWVRDTSRPLPVELGGYVGTGTINAALSTLYNAGVREVTLSSGTYRIGAGSYPNLVLRIVGSAKLTVDSGTTPEVGSITAELKQCIQGTGNLILGGDIHPDWWGADTASLTKAFDASGVNGTVVISRSYNLTSTLVINNAARVRSAPGVTLTAGGASLGVSVSGLSNVDIELPMLSGFNTAIQLQSVHGGKVSTPLVVDAGGSTTTVLAVSDTTHVDVNVWSALNVNTFVSFDATDIIGNVFRGGRISGNTLADWGNNATVANSGLSKLVINQFTLASGGVLLKNSDTRVVTGASVTIDTLWVTMTAPTKLVSGMFVNLRVKAAMQHTGAVISDLFNLKGYNNNFDWGVNDHSNSTAKTALDTSNPTGFNGGVGMISKDSKLTYTTLSDLVDGAELVLRAYHQEANGSKINYFAKLLTSLGVLVSRVRDNGAAVPGEVLITLRNVSNNTIASGTTIDFMLTSEGL